MEEEIIGMLASKVTSRTLNFFYAPAFKHVLVSLWTIVPAGIFKSETKPYLSCRSSVAFYMTKSNPSSK